MEDLIVLFKHQRAFLEHITCVPSSTWLCQWARISAISMF